jgi:hypothetical protein
MLTEDERNNAIIAFLFDCRNVVLPSQYASQTHNGVLGFYDLDFMMEYLCNNLHPTRAILTPEYNHQGNELTHLVVNGRLILPTQN